MANGLNTDLCKTIIKTPYAKPAAGLLLSCALAFGITFSVANPAFFMHRILTETITSPMFPENEPSSASFFETDSLGRIYLDTSPAEEPRLAESPLQDPVLPESGNDSQQVASSSLRKPVVVKKGDTLGKILTSGSVANSEIFSATAALRPHFKPTSLKPGQQITLIYDGLPENPYFAGLEIEPTPGTILTVSRTENGDFTSSTTKAALERHVTAARTTINSSLFEAGAKVGVPASVMANMIRIFSWDIDFQRDIHAGDQFSVLFEEYYTPSGKQVKTGNILYAALKVGNDERVVYRFEDSDGIVDYYGENGKSIRKALLKTPVDGARVSSGYGLRKHPILGYSKMHKGVDFAAPTGTPIFAAGDGVIEQIGPWSSYGNYVRLRHNNSLSTAYAHLSRFGKNLKKGSRVSQGQVIGYVGTTGRSTGPHLHYEVVMAGKQVNPNSVDLPTGREIARKDKDTFSAVVAQHNSEYQEALSQSTIVATAP